jgi:hypothetical protein
MEIHEVPQDEAYMIEGKIRDVCYVVDQNGRYTSTLSMGWKPKNEAIRLAWAEIYKQAEETRRQVLSGELSPIALYMKLNVMDVKMLSGYSGIPRRLVKRHLQMKYFIQLSPDMLQKYADALNMSPEDLVDIHKIREMNLDHED